MENSKIWECQPTLPVSWETCIWVKKQQVELGIAQLTGCELGKKYNKDVYCYSAYLISMQGYSFSSSHVWMWELDHKGSWAQNNWCFWTVVLEKTLAPKNSLRLQDSPRMQTSGPSFSLQLLQALQAKDKTLWKNSLSQKAAHVHQSQYTVYSKTICHSRGLVINFPSCKYIPLGVRTASSCYPRKLWNTSSVQWNSCQIWLWSAPYRRN